MPFLCPDCLSPKSLKITLKLELPPDNRSDEITVQVVECARCGFGGIAVYEESRRGALDNESYNHIGYYVNKRDFDSVKEEIKRCPNPGSWLCECDVHRGFGRKDLSGRWNGLADIQRKGPFNIR